MPKISLTDAFILGEKCLCPEGKPQEDYRDAHPRGRGLVLRVSKSGLKKWNFIYSMHGKERRLTLPEYGRGEDQLTLAQARKRAAMLRAQVLLGEDPAAQAAEMRAEMKRQQGETVKAMLEQRIANLRRKGRRESYLTDLNERFSAHVLPRIGDKPLAQVTQAEIAAILSPLEAAGMVATYNKLLTILPPLWDVARLDDPIRGNFERLPENESPEPFTLDEVRAILAALDEPAAKVHPVTRAAIRFAAFTLKRSGECASAMVSEIDNKNNLWTIPGSKMKGGRPETVPLSQQALDVIDGVMTLPVRPDIGRDPVAVFVSPRDAASSITQNSMSRAFVRARRIAGVLGDGRTLHSLRHSGATALAATGVPPHIIQSLLGHKSAGASSRVTQRYNQYEFLNERRQCLETLAALVGPGHPGRGGEVINLH
ncbi:MAG: site-specific integrase [Pseudomonadota bacterium]